MSGPTIIPALTAAVIYSGVDDHNARSLVTSLALLDVRVRRIDVDTLPRLALEARLPSSLVSSAIQKIAGADFVLVLTPASADAQTRVDALVALLPPGATARGSVLPLAPGVRAGADAFDAQLAALVSADTDEDLPRFARPGSEALIAC